MEQKQCSKCKVSKPVIDFYPRNDRGRFTPHCKLCSSAKHKVWYEKNKVRCLSGVVVVPETKKCWRCRIVKQSKEFGRSNSHSDGLNPSCKLCAASYSMRVGNPLRRERDPHGRHAQLWARYRLRPSEFTDIFKKQDGKCGICKGLLPKTPQVDHCHASGKVRGLLCNSCNVGMGYIDKNWFWNAAMLYLNGTGG